MAKDCPEKPAEVCRNCQQEGEYNCSLFIVFLELRDERKQATSLLIARTHEKSTDLTSR
jgi:hypothetical protein